MKKKKIIVFAIDINHSICHHPRPDRGYISFEFSGFSIGTFGNDKENENDKDKENIRYADKYLWILS